MEERQMTRIIDKGIKKKMPRGTMLYEKGQEVKEILLLLQGKIRGEDGKERIEISSGGILGLIDGIGKEYLYQYSLEADSLVLVFPYADFHNEVRELVLVGFSLGVANEMLNCIIDQTRHFYEKYKGLKQKAQQLYSIVKEDYALCEKVSKGCLIPFEKSPKIENMFPFDVEDALLREHDDYFGNLSTIPMEIRNTFFMANSYITIKHIEDLVMIASEVEDCYEEAKKYLITHGERILGEDKENLFSLYKKLFFNIGNN